MRSLHWSYRAIRRFASRCPNEAANRIVRRALTGDVTEEMQRHYSTVGMDDKRAAVAGVLRVVDVNVSKSGTNGGNEPKLKVTRPLEVQTRSMVRP
jgi:hypothetical protein